MRRTLSIIGVCACLAGHAFGYEPGPPEIKAKLALEVPDSIKLNEPFQVTFTFETLEALCVDSARPDRALILPPGNAVFVSGDTLWVGHLSPGQTASLRATYRIVKPQSCSFAAQLRTQGPKYWRLDTKQLALGRRHINGLLSRNILFPDAPQERMMPSLIITDSGVVEGEPVPLPAQRAPYGMPTPVVENSGSSACPRPHRDDIRPGEKRPALYIRLIDTAPDTIRAYCYPGRPYEFITPDSSDRVSVDLVSGDAAFRRKSDRVGMFDLRSDSAIFRVTAGSVRRVVVLVSPR